MTIDEVIENNKLFSSDNQITELNIMQIASINEIGGGGLFIGLGKDNADKIYKVAWCDEQRVKFVANNIFEFIRSLQCVKNPVRGVNIDKLYKNWGEYFWRLRED